jgi:hypothetical protein
VANGDRLLKIAIYPDDIDATATRLGESVFSMENTDSGGTR